MFIGHYGVGFGGKKIDQGPSLGTMFMAVQWLDLVWPVLVLTGIEKVSIDPGNTVMTPLDFESYPWSHSLLMAVVWGLLFLVVYRLVTGNMRGAWLLCFLVISHWVLDWLTHRPDLQLSPFGEQRAGLGLWNHPVAAIVIEVAIFLAGVWIYATSTRAKNKTGRWAFWSLVVLFLLIHFMNAFGSTPPGVEVVAWMAMAQWLFVAWGYWIDANRQAIIA